MADLIAQGPQSDQHWRRELPSVLSGITPVIGRSESDWVIPWDSRVSRRHVRLIPLPEDRVEVVVLPEAKNPVFHQGSKATRFTLVPGDHFVIGQTTLMLSTRPSISDPVATGDVTETTFDLDRLDQRQYRNSAARIDMLSRLPDLVAGSSSDEELFVRVTDVLLRATTGATAVAIVATRIQTPSPASGEVSEESVEVLHYDTRALDTEPPSISDRLVRAAISRRESVLHTWSSQAKTSALFTANEEADWAFCVPLRGDACPGWAIYVTGQSRLPMDAFSGQGEIENTPAQLEDDLKFAGLVATTLSSIRHAQQLQQRQASIRQFFSPVVMRALANQKTEEVLRPREVDLSVMFCDLRGFSRHSERRAERLLDLLERVSDALGVMTHHILDTGGVIGDFHGDAAMGFWGWPLRQQDSATRAADAALRIRDDYANRQDSTDFRCGIGIASGRGVAGQIGTVDQVKVTAFGPVVNLASRLEGLTKVFGTDIIVDQATVKLIENAPKEFTKLVRIRRLARVRPKGMDSVADIFELRPNTPEDVARLSDDEVRRYEACLEMMCERRWSDAYDLLLALPPSDRPKDVLLSLILRHNRVAPPDWDGVISFTEQ